MSYGFPFHTIEQLYEANRGAAFQLPKPGEVETLLNPVQGKNFRLRNGLAIHPMEGADGVDGAPGPLTLRRYDRFARGGAGLLWVEAIAVSEESMANPNQLRITASNVGAFREMVAGIRLASREAHGDEPLIIAQLTHSGRYSKPNPIRAWKSAALDERQNLPEDWPIITDEELAALPGQFARATALCREAGFDGVDVKACHLYLLSELLGATDRPGPYGGSYENRTRVYLEAVDAAISAISGGVLAARINVYDGTAGNFGVGEGGGVNYDEPQKLVEALTDRGATLLNITMGTPYFNPHVNRPYSRGGYLPPETPVDGVARLLHGCSAAQKAAGDNAVCVATGFSYLRHFGPAVAAGLIASGGAKVAGFGRQGFAYPDFPRDLAKKGRLDSEKCCVACGLCTVIMRAGGRTGCPVRDGGTYLKELYPAIGRA